MRALGAYCFDQSFFYCRYSISITLPEGMTRIPNNCFCRCRSLERIEVDEKNEKYVSENGVLFTREGRTLVQYPVGNNRTTYIIPTGVRLIDDFAFQGADKLVRILLPKTLKLIEMYAFSLCSSLKSVTISDSETTIAANAFKQCSSLVTVSLGTKVKTLGDYSFFETGVKEITTPLPRIT